MFIYKRLGKIADAYVTSLTGVNPNQAEPIAAKGAAVGEVILGKDKSKDPSIVSTKDKTFISFVKDVFNKEESPSINSIIDKDKGKDKSEMVKNVINMFYKN
jgi:hypothetical protein